MIRFRAPTGQLHTTSSAKTALHLDRYTLRLLYSPPFLLFCLSLVFAAVPLHAQQQADSAIVVAPDFATDNYIDSRAPIELNLSRLPTPGEGRLAIFIGNSDVTSLFEAAGSKLVYRANGFDLPAGESQLKVFLVGSSGWNELASVPLRVLTPRGFEKAQVDPGIELNNTGQLKEGLLGTQPASARPTYQQLGGTLSLQTVHTRGGTSISSDTHVLGANERKDALRFGELGDKASRIDLADYVVQLQRRGAVLSLGQVTAGMNRHLINGFGSRGVTIAANGSRVTWSAGAENGTSIVGTNNITGLDNPDHRIVSSTLGIELVPARPGALHFDATALHGKVLALSGTNQSGNIAADQSDGYGVQVAASTPSQRVRAAAGLAVSKSQYAADAQSNSSGSSSLQSPAHRKNARYAELYVGLLQNHKFGKLPVTLDMSLHHERVDPLYRSVAAFVQSDIQHEDMDVGGNIDAITARVAAGRSVDNLANAATLLTTRSRSTTASFATPLAALLRVTRAAAWLPTLSYARQQMHQFGAGIPTGFSASDIPDQMSVIHDASAQWQVKQWQFGYHLNVSEQDNRQPGHEQSDFGATTQGLTVGVMVAASLSLGTELGIERQNNKEFALINTLRRASASANWRINELTTIDAAFNISHAVDPAAASNTHVGSAQAGISRSFNLWHSTDSTPRGQAFLRFSRYSNDVFALGSSFGPPTLAMGTWHIASGLTLRIF